MNCRNLFTAVAVVCTFYGLTLIVAPEDMAHQYLTNPVWINDGLRLLAQLHGAFLLAFALTCWYVRNAEPSPGRRAMLLLLLLSNSAFVVVHLVAMSRGVETPFGWVPVMISGAVAGCSGRLFRQEQEVLT